MFNQPFGRQSISSRNKRTKQESVTEAAAPALCLITEEERVGCWMLRPQINLKACIFPETTLWVIRNVKFT